ncbi:DNA breaking-rejoining enzyme [Armillaria fumosa]|nr:DNA breaking-rejoining enzyme [Armillaria fumosa]
MHNTNKGPSDIQRSYSHAQKLHAGLTYGFCKSGRGKDRWNEHMASGNPSISDLISSYMLGLHKRKVTKGEAPTSARAITVYLIAFTCLLHIDEALNIQAHDISFYVDEVDNTHCMSITLPFCKTNPFGHKLIITCQIEIQPFVLRALPNHMAHLCPVITHGYVFHKIDKRDHPILTKNSPMTAEVFLELFRNNLWDLGIAPYPYSTHSFRHGGCQWLSVDLRWSLQQICEWGGWSTDFTHLTIVKYLISWNDDLMTQRDDFFKLDCEATIKCWSCGRTCPCA